MKPQNFRFVKRAGLQWLESRSLSSIPWVRHAFTTRVLRRTGLREGRSARGGRQAAAGLNLGFVEGDRRARILENRRRFLDGLGVGTLALASLRQIHSSVVYEVSNEGAGRFRCILSGCTPGRAADTTDPSGDALMTGHPGILLSVRTADCLPILLVDPARHAIAAVHAGWRGLLQRIAEKAVGEMRRAFRSRPEDLLAAMGPSIRACCYEVGPEVVESFRGRFALGEGYFQDAQAREGFPLPALQYPGSFLAARPPGRGPDSPAVARLDLVAAARDQLRNAGLRPANIHAADFCTACRTDLFYSHRKEGKTGRMMAVIGMV